MVFSNSLLPDPLALDINFAALTGQLFQQIVEIMEQLAWLAVTLRTAPLARREAHRPGNYLSCPENGNRMLIRTNFPPVVAQSDSKTKACM
jgi:hypothetical protein